MSRIFISDDPYLNEYRDKPVPELGKWPASWVICPDLPLAPFVSAYRRRFRVDAPGMTVRLHISADERYELFLDGRRVGRGPERGDAAHWFFETYEFALGAGEHVLVAKVWSLGEDAPLAQLSRAAGFLCSPQDAAHQPLLGTGTAEWEAKVLGGYNFTDKMTAWGTGAKLAVDGLRFDWGFEFGAGSGWRDAVRGEPASGPLACGYSDALAGNLHPATLPPMLDEARHIGRVRLVAAIDSLTTHPLSIRAVDDLPDERDAWQRLIDGRAGLALPPRTRRRIILDLDDYYCAYPEVRVSGGAGSTVRVHWQEALYEALESEEKGQRDEIEGKFFVTCGWPRDGVGDRFHLDGGAHRTFNTLWWECGRYVEIVVETLDEAMEIESFLLWETRYPLEHEGRFTASDARLTQAVPLMVRALQMCSHETYMDCPYYEQLMYIGDTRVEALATYVLTADTRLPRKALKMFDISRRTNGLTMSRYPSRIRQIIPPFSLWYVCMIEDFALWRGAPSEVRALLPGMRGVVDYFASRRNADGLVDAPEGWNYLDWASESPRSGNPDAGQVWPWGCPPDGSRGISNPLNWQCVLAFDTAARLEAWCGEPELAARAQRLATGLSARLVEAFWVEERGLFADDLGRTHFSEHSQCLGLLSGRLDATAAMRVEEGLATDPNLTRATIYFSHYVLEALQARGRMQELLDRLEPWFELKRNGLRTTIEKPEPTRSDCHAWGAHPLYHYYASILGIRPAEYGFGRVRITPQLGSLEWAHGILPHPGGGMIEASFRRENGTLHGLVHLPEGVTGALEYGGQRLELPCGWQEFLLR